MKCIVTGSLGHIGSKLAPILLEAGHDITIISRNQDRIPVIRNLGATAAIGSLDDACFLADAFDGADAIFTMIPPNPRCPNLKEFIADIGQKYAIAIQETGVRYVVNLSSIGAHMPEGCGEISGLYFVEQALNDLDGVNVLHLRPGLFYTDFLAGISMIKESGAIARNYGTGVKLVLTSPDDVAETAAREMQALDFREKSYRYIVSDEKTTDEIAGILGSSISMPELEWVNITDEESMRNYMKSGMSEDIAMSRTEIGAAIRRGELTADYALHPPHSEGKYRFEDFAMIFAEAYAKASRLMA